MSHGFDFANAKSDFVCSETELVVSNPGDLMGVRGLAPVEGVAEIPERSGEG